MGTGVFRGTMEVLCQGKILAVMLSTTKMQIKMRLKPSDLDIVQGCETELAVTNRMTTKLSSKNLKKLCSQSKNSELRKRY